MKLIIDIPDEGYDWIKNGFPDNEDKEFLIEAVKNSTPYEERPEGDLISREALKKAMFIDDPISIADTWEQLYYAVVNAIDNAPAVYDNPYSDGREDGYIEGYEEAKRESERSQGEWIVAYHSCGDTYYFCSACKEGKAMDLASGDLTIKDFKCCPNCGAFMVKGGVE